MLKNSLNCWAYSVGEQSVERCEAILEDMQRQGPTPSLIPYNRVLKALGRVRGRGDLYAKKEEVILDTLERRSTSDPTLYPDNYSYTAAISAYGRSIAKDKASKALELLERDRSALIRMEIIEPNLYICFQCSTERLCFRFWQRFSNQTRNLWRSYVNHGSAQNAHLTRSHHLWHRVTCLLLSFTNLGFPKRAHSGQHIPPGQRRRPRGSTSSNTVVFCCIP